MLAHSEIGCMSKQYALLLLYEIQRVMLYIQMHAKYWEIWYRFHIHSFYFTLKSMFLHVPFDRLRLSIPVNWKNSFVLDKGMRTFDHDYYPPCTLSSLALINMTSVGKLKLQFSGFASNSIIITQFTSLVVSHIEQIFFTPAQTYSICKEKQ